MDDIVKATGMSKGGLYWHFKSKEEIFLYIIEKWIFETEEELLALLTGNGSAQEKLKNLEKHFVKQINGPVSAILHEFTLQAKDKEILNKLDICILNFKRKSIVRDFIQSAIHRGEFRTLDAEAAADVLISIFEGIGLLWFVQQKDEKALHHTANMAMDIFFNGVLRK